MPKKKSKKKAPRTRKQIAAAKRNIKKAIAASKKARRNLGNKTNKQRRSRSGSHMPKKKKSGGKRRPGKKSFIDRIPILNNPTVQKVGFGLGMGVIVADIINLAARFAPPAISGPLQANQGLIKLGVELATEPLSAVVDVALNPQMLSRLTGGMNGTAAPGTNMAGFA